MTNIEGDTTQFMSLTDNSILMEHICPSTSKQIMNQQSSSNQDELDNSGTSQSNFLQQKNPCLSSTDWSRQTRKYLSILNAGSNPMQTKITFYFKLIENIEGIVAYNPSLVTCANQSGDKQNTIPVAFPSLLQKLMHNALLNSEKLPKQYRHDEVLKKFAVSLFLYAGPVAYSFIQQNMPQALPSLRSVQRSVHNEYLIIHEGQFRFDELLVHLNRYNSPKVITIGEDATRLIARVDYDSETNRLVGFVLPLNRDGLPLLDAHLAKTFTSIEESFAKISNV